MSGKKLKRALSDSKRVLGRELKADEVAAEAAGLLVDTYGLPEGALPHVYDVVARAHRAMARATALELEGR